MNVTKPNVFVRLFMAFGFLTDPGDGTVYVYFFAAARDTHNPVSLSHYLSLRQ